MMWLQENSSQQGDPPALPFPCTPRMGARPSQSGGCGSPVPGSVCRWGGQLLWKDELWRRCTPSASQAGCRLPIGSGLWPSPLHAWGLPGGTLRCPEPDLLRGDPSAAGLCAWDRPSPRLGARRARTPPGRDPPHPRVRVPSPGAEQPWVPRDHRLPARLLMGAAGPSALR